MSDVANAGGTPSGEQEKIAPVGGAADAGNPGAADATAPLSALAEGDDAAPVTPAAWRDDWREALAGGDEKELARLKRFSSLENLHKSYRQAEKRFSAPPPVPTLPEDATDEQKAEYRKAIGVPETPDGYGLAFLPDLKPGDSETAMLQDFKAHALATNKTPAQAKADFDWYQQRLMQQRDEQIAAAARNRHHVQTELRREFGSDYKRNLALADEFIEAHPGIGKLVNSGNPDIELVRDLISVARATASPDAIYAGDAEAGGKSLDDQVAELLTKKLSGNATQGDLAKYDKLFAAQYERDQKRNNKRVAA